MNSPKQNVLVTGASTGLGLALARRLMGSEDLRLILTAREASLSRFDELGLRESERVHLRPLRVNTDCERREVVHEIEDKWGGVDVLVNNAGVAYRAVLEHLKEEEMQRQMEINFSAPLQLMRLVLPGMRAKRNGRIINVSSVSGMVAMPTMAPYSASKWALEGVSEALWYEMRPWNVRVTIVEPGFIRSDSFLHTRMTMASQAAFENKEDPYHQHYVQMDELISRFMRRALATPESVAGKIERVIRSSNPPLRLAATLDAHIFGKLSRLLPRPFFHWLLYHALPNVRAWGDNGNVEADRYPT